MVRAQDVTACPMPNIRHGKLGSSNNGAGIVAKAPETHATLAEASGTLYVRECDDGQSLRLAHGDPHPLPRIREPCRYLLRGDTRPVRNLLLLFLTDVTHTHTQRCKGKGITNQTTAHRFKYRARLSDTVQSSDTVT